MSATWKRLSIYMYVSLTHLFVCPVRVVVEHRLLEETGLSATDPKGHMVVNPLSLRPSVLVLALDLVSLHQLRSVFSRR